MYYIIGEKDGENYFLSYQISDNTSGKSHKPHVFYVWAFSIKEPNILKFTEKQDAVLYVYLLSLNDVNSIRIENI